MAGTQYMKGPTANEIFANLFGRNLASSLVIESFGSIKKFFKCRHACIVVKQFEETFFFPLPGFEGKFDSNKPADVQSFGEQSNFVLEHLSSLTPDLRSNIDYVIETEKNGQWNLGIICNLQNSGNVASKKRSTGAIALVLHNEGHAHKCIFKDKIDNGHLSGNIVEFHDILAVYFAYFDQLLRDLSFIPLKIIEAEWYSNLSENKSQVFDEKHYNGGLPWGDKKSNETPTITVSLDLRKSTFAMQQASDRDLYAHWLMAVSELSREITLQHGGIFDKFTGDGIISHFVFQAGDQAAKQDAINSAILSAVELVHAIELHIANILGSLKFKSKSFGPAVGMAVDTAAWSLDRDGKPVVVGQGIVNACRLNGGLSGLILVTNDLKSEISEKHPELNFSEYELGDTHKEFGSELQASCWSVNAFNARIGRTRSQLAILIEEIWNQN